MADDPPRAGYLALWTPAGTPDKPPAGTPDKPPAGTPDKPPAGTADDSRAGSASASSGPSYHQGGQRHTTGVAGPAGGRHGQLILVLPAGAGVRRRTVPVRRILIAEAIDALVDLPAAAEVTPSVQAWATAARLAVELIARGRILPGITAGGIDCWRLGPLDPADRARLDQLAAALPAPGHAVWVPGSRPLRVVSPATAVAAFGDAVADAFVRTAAAPTAAGQHAFAARQPVDVASAAEWLALVAAGGREDASVALRLVPPEDPTDDGQPFAAVVQLQSRRDPSLVVDAADLWAAPETVLARFGPDAETGLLLALRRGSRVWPPLTRLLDQARPGRLDLDDGETDDLLGPITDELASAGVGVLWPVELIRPLSLRPVVATPTPAAVTGSGLTLDSLMELRWRASLDGEDLTDAELKTLAEAKRPLVRLRGRWVRADPERLARLGRRRTVPVATALAAALGGTITLGGEAVDAEIEGPLVGLVERLRALSGRDGGPPDGDRTLGGPPDGRRAFSDLDGGPPDGRRALTDPDGGPPDGQRAPGERRPPPGLEAVLRPYQGRGLAWLAEMAELGLGGILADDMGLGKTIQLLALHLDRVGHGLPTLIICPASVIANWEREAARFAPTIKVRRFHGAGRRLDDLDGPEIVLATYGVARREAETLAGVGWGLVAADEAQAIKNPLSRTARAMRRLPAQARFALTGTPVENRLTDLWALLDWTTPGLLGPLEEFRREVAIPVERHRDIDASAALTRLVRPFLLRRRKSDPAIAPELPQKTETDQVVPLSQEQATLYAAVAAETLEQISATDGIARRGLVLKLLTALKQICNHPAQYLGQTGPLDRRSGKLDATAELLEVIAEVGDAALIFSQYVAMGRLLHQHLVGRGIETVFLHGSLSIGQRQQLVDRFQAGEATAFVISLKAGGTGLNLTRATHVLHYDRWWNPAVEDQASDRAWRIGQDRPVQVHRLLCEGTLEERIAGVLAQKRQLADAVVGAGEGWISELSDEDLTELVALSGTGA